jgi:hypothetical protein
MKRLLFTVLIIGNLAFTYAQVHTFNQYDDGTRITYYVNECGNEIPEAEGKIHFCDAAGNQGVVENSFGLNSNYVERMEDNFFNDDQIFLTHQGLSIRKEDGTWDNVPNRAAPNFFGEPGQSGKQIKEALRLPDGNIIFIGNGIGQQVDVYNPSTKELSAILMDTLDNNSYPWAIEYDADRDAVWILGGAFANRKLYIMEDYVISEVADIALSTILSSYQTDVCAYADDNLYFISNLGLTSIDLENGYAETLYDNSNTGMLPFDYTQDIEVASDGKIWLAQFQNTPGDGSLTRFDPVTETYEMYQLANPNNNAINLYFNSLGIAPDGKIWATASNYGANISLDISAEEPAWTVLDNAYFESIGLPYIYNVEFIHSQNGRTYFCTNSNSTSANDAYEILVLEAEDWTGINDNEEGNFSYRMTNVNYSKLLSDPDGGIWWLDQYGEELLYLKDEDDFHFEHVLDFATPEMASINPIGMLSMHVDSEFGSYVDGEFTAYEAFNNAYFFSASSNAGQSVWAYNWSGSTQDLVRYVNGNIAESHTFLEDELFGFYDFTALTDGRLAFSRPFNGDIFTKIYDPVTGTFDELNTIPYQGLMREVIPAENGAFWIISAQGLVFYDGISDSPLILNQDNTVLDGSTGNYSIYDAVLDTDMNLHVIQGYGMIYTFSPPYENLLAETILFTGDNGLMPHQNGTQQGYWTIGLDAEGDLWFGKIQETLFELKDDVNAGEFFVDIAVGLAESQLPLEFRAYPNPVEDGSLFVELPMELAQAEAQIYDLSGKLIQSFELKTSSTSLNLPNIRPGVYALRITSDIASGSRMLLIK